MLQPAEQVDQEETSSNGFRCAVVDGLEGVMYAVSDGSLVLKETLLEMRADITQTGETSQATLKEMKRMEETLHQFQSESERQFNALLSKLSVTNQDALDISRKITNIQEGVKQLQVSNLLLYLEKEPTVCIGHDDMPGYIRYHRRRG